ncbi:MAG: SpoIIE family protein phosphatase [Herpetosiphonaceae bacterium]|nr:SpoIIE family protein phosphatase [Herpetosiphonaceae bacterium]
MGVKAPSRLRSLLLPLLGVLNLRQRRIQELSLLNEASRAIIRAELDVDALCELVYQQASKVLDTSWFHLALFEELNYELKVRIQNGQRLPPEVFNLSENEGLMGWMRRTGRALLVEDFERELPHLPAQPRYHAEHPPRSGIYVPLLAGDTVIGTISVQSSRPRHFNANDLRFLSLIADGAASAIAKARAYDALRTRIRQLQLIGEVGRQAATFLDLDQLLPSVVQLIRDSFGYFAVHLFMVDDEHQQLLFRASTATDLPFWRGRHERLDYGEGVIGAVARTREPLLVNDVHREPRFILDLAGTQSELAVPLTVGERLLAVLDVQSDRLNAFDDNDRFVLQTLAAQLAVALDAANAYTQQQQEAWTLAALLETAKNIARASDLDGLLATIVRLPAVLVGCDRVAVWRYVHDDDTFAPVAVWGWPADARAALLNHPLPGAAAPLLDEVRKSGVHQQIDNLAMDPEMLPAVARYCGGSQLLALPLVTRATVLGILLLDADPGRPNWSESQITIALGIANQAVGAMESILLAQAAAQQARLTQEIRVAREIQTDLLPASTPQLVGWDIAAAWRSAREVGGDFYDFWELTGPRLGFVIADVSDKGVPAALFMALSRSLMRAAALDGSDPCYAVERANRWITRDSQSGMFVTLFYGLLNPLSGELVYTNAGHNPPLWVQTDGTVTPLATADIALGVIEHPQFHEATTTLEPGDVLVCYTDGVTEAINSTEVEYSVARLTTLIQQHRAVTAHDIVEAILDDLLVHTGNLPAFDDVTLVVIKRNSIPAS